MITVTIYVRKEDPSCIQALADLESLQGLIPHQLAQIDVDSDQALVERYGDMVPFIQIGPYQLQTPFTRQDLQVAMGAAQDRQNHLEKVGDITFQNRIERGHSLTRSDQFTDWFSKHYMLFFNALLAVYVGLPFLAPVLLKDGIDPPAKLIYAIYSPLCHQLSFRSWFLFGQQAYYPRELAHIPNVITYEELSGSNSIDLATARAFTGNPQAGYKVALCERDVAIYGSLLLYGLIFSITGRKIKAFPWYIWLFIGLVPIGLDGFSQIPGLTGGFPSWIPIRESTPFLRTLTGALFGFTTAGYLFPVIEESMKESRRILARKKAVIVKDSEN
jgi:uncharacterized membrane protein